LILFALGKKKRKEIIPLFIDIKRLRSRINQEYDVILQKEGSAIEQAPLPQHRHLHPKCFSPIHHASAEAPLSDPEGLAGFSLNVHKMRC